MTLCCRAVSGTEAAVCAAVADGVSEHQDVCAAVTIKGICRSVHASDCTPVTCIQSASSTSH